MAQFEFGDKVLSDKWGIGVVVGNEHNVNNVYFEMGGLCFSYPDSSELQPVSCWIKIDWDDTSTLPEDGATVLVTIDNSYFIATFNSGLAWPVFMINNWPYNTKAEHSITHWQPLPQPPK